MWHDLPPANSFLQAVQTIFLAALSAGVLLIRHWINAEVRYLQWQLTAERSRCDGLEKRVRSLEKRPRKRQRPKKPRRPKPRR